MVVVENTIICMAACCSGNAQISINKVTPHQARLAHGWVTVCRHETI